jgi:hypothetical protein
VAGLGDKRTAAFRIAWAACRNFPLALLLGLVPGLILVLIAVLGRDRGALFWVVFIIGVFAALIGSLALVAIAFFKRFLGVLPSNFDGLCTGLSDGKTKTNQAEALTPWLRGYLNALAGRP